MLNPFLGFFLLGPYQSYQTAPAPVPHQFSMVPSSWFLAPSKIFILIMIISLNRRRHHHNHHQHVCSHSIPTCGWELLIDRILVFVLWILPNSLVRQSGCNLMTKYTQDLNTLLLMSLVVENVTAVEALLIPLLKGHF